MKKILTLIACLLTCISAMLNAFGCVLRIHDEKKRKKMLLVCWILVAILTLGYIYVFARVPIKQ